MSRDLDFISLPGLTSFTSAREMQLGLLERRIRDEIPDTLLFVEHAPVITRGRGLQFTGEAREKQSAPPIGLGLDGKIRIPSADGELVLDYVECERGGDLTFHGPGQVVGYPIVKLDGGAPWAPKHDLGIYLRKMEATLGRVLSGNYGIETVAREHATGVWVKGEPDRKIASIGIAIRKWVTYHGFAFNVSTDLRAYYTISPCGFAPEVMTRLVDLVRSSSLTRAEVEREIFQAWVNQ